MKKLIFILITFFCVIGVSAQEKYFTLTPNWLVSTADSTKNYVVITIDSNSAEQLYKKTINYINRSYRDPENVIRGKSENEFLTFTSNEKILMTLNRNYPINIEYFTILSYKENKIKITFHTIAMYFYSNDGSRVNFYLNGSSLWYWSIFKEDGSLYFPKKKNKEKIESFFNSKIDEIIVGIKESGIQNEDW